MTVNFSPGLGDALGFWIEYEELYMSIKDFFLRSRHFQRCYIGIPWSRGVPSLWEYVLSHKYTIEEELHLDKGLHGSGRSIKVAQDVAAQEVKLTCPRKSIHFWCFEDNGRRATEI